MTLKISTILISVILVGIFMTGITSYLAGMEEFYSPLPANVTQNFSSEVTYVDAGESVKGFVVTDNESIKEQTENMASSGIGGAILDFFSGGIKVFVMIVSAPGYVITLLTQVIGDLPGTSDGFIEKLNFGLQAIVYIVIFVGIIWAVLVRRDQL